MTRIPSLTVAAALAAAMVLSPGVARAEAGLVDQVETLEFERGELEAEGQFVHARRDGEDTLLMGATLEYAVSDSIQFGLEVEGERETDETFSVEGLGLQIKWIALDPAEYPLGLGIQSAAVLDPSSGAIGTETFFIAESRAGEFDLAANLVVNTDPDDFSDISVSYAARTDRELSARVSLGIEAGGALSGEGQGSHFLGPVIALGLAEENEAEIELGVFLPLSEEAPDLQLRLELDFAF